jgi:hypothetical protein
MTASERRIDFGKVVLNEPTDDDLLLYRKEKFRVEVSPSRSPSYSGEVSLSITTNGFQWSSIGLLPDEINAVIKALTAHARSARGKKHAGTS